MTYIRLVFAAAFLVTVAQSMISASFEQIGVTVKFVVDISQAGGVPPYTHLWDFGNGKTSTEPNPNITYDIPEINETYQVNCTVTSSDGNVIETVLLYVEINHIDIVKKAEGLVRFAQFNTGFSDHAGRVNGVLASRLQNSSWIPARKIADVIQKNDPDVLSLQEFDHLWFDNENWNEEGTRMMVDNLQKNFLSIPQADGNSAVSFPYVFIAPCNTGVQTGYDLNKNGVIGDAGDAHGYGDFPGAFSMVLLSKYPIIKEKVRTFQHFLWKDMPGAYLPRRPETGEMYYSQDELNVLRLSSKSHWDIPIHVKDEEVVHVLMSHPTPPVFDDGTAMEYPSTKYVDWNGFKNNNEIRFWTDYINPEYSSYIYDDAEWKASGNKTPSTPSGGLEANQRFVVMGDQNCDPVDGDATLKPINVLLDSSLTDTSLTPESDGADEQIPTKYQNRRTKTAPWGLRADYVLPSDYGLNISSAYVYWPVKKNVEAYLLDASDHMMVVVDLNTDETKSSKAAKGTKASRKPTMVKSYKN